MVIYSILYIVFIEKCSFKEILTKDKKIIQFSDSKLDYRKHTYKA